MTEGRVETESRCQECLAIIKGEITSNDLSKRRVRSRTHGVVGGRGLVAPSYPIIQTARLGDDVLEKHRTKKLTQYAVSSKLSQLFISFSFSDPSPLQQSRRVA